MAVIIAPIAAVFGGGVIATAVTTVAVNVAIGYVANKVFAPDVGSASASASPDPGVKTRLPASTSNKLPVIYGNTRVRGAIIFGDISSNNKKLAFIIALADGEINSIGTARWDDKVLTLDSDGVVTKATSEDGTTHNFLNGNLKIVKYPAGGRCSEMEDFSSKWDDNSANRTMPDTAYVYVELTYDRDEGVTGLTSDLSFDVKGRKIRTLSLVDGVATLSSTESYSIVPAECLIDYMTNSRYGCGELFTDADLNLQDMLDWKDFTEVFKPYVDNQGVSRNGRVHKTNGFINTNDSRQQALADMTVCGSAQLTYNQGKFGVIIDTTATSVKSFDEDNIYGNVSVSDQGFASVLNRVVMKFSERKNFYQEGQVYLETPSASKNANEPELVADITLPFTNNNIEAERLGAIILNDSRNSQVISFKTDMTALELEPGDVITVSNKAFGITDKLYRIISINDGSIYSGVDSYAITAKEYSASVYDDRTIVEVDDTPNTNFSTPWEVSSVASPTITNINNESLVPNFQLNWTVPDDSLITYFEIRARKSPDTKFRNIKTVSLENDSYTAGDTISEIITELEAGTYKFTVFAGNSFGASTSGVASANLVWNPMRAPLAITESGTGTIPASIPDPTVSWDVINDDIVITTYTDGQTIQKYDGTSWSTLSEYFDGGLVYDGTVTADKIRAGEIFSEQSLSVAIPNIQDAILWVDGDDADDPTQTTPTINTAWTGAGYFSGLVDNPHSGSTVVDVPILLVGDATKYQFFDGTDTVISGITLDAVSLTNTSVDATLNVENNGTNISTDVTTINAGTGIVATGTGGTITISAEAQEGTGTDLSVGTRAATTLIVESSSGDNVTLPASTSTQAGLITSTQHTKLAGIETGATADQTDAEIVTAAGSDTNLKALVDFIGTPVFTDTDTDTTYPSQTQTVWDAGTSTVESTITAKKLSDAIDTHQTDTVNPSQTQTVWNTGTSTVESIISPKKLADTIDTHQSDTTYPTQTKAVWDAGTVTIESVVSPKKIADAIAALETPDSGNTTYTASTGLSLNGTAFSVTNPFTDADETKLDGIETSATADQTDAEIVTAAGSDSNLKSLIDFTGTPVFTDTDTNTTYTASTGITLTGTAFSVTNPFTDADETKLDGIETGATADQTDAEIVTAAGSDANIKSLIDASSPVFTDTTYTGGTGVTLLNGAFNIDNVFTGTEKTKLSGIETGATADQTGAQIVTAINGSTSLIDDNNIAASIARDSELPTGAITYTGDVTGSVSPSTAAQSKALTISNGAVTGDKLASAVINLEKVAVEQMQNLVFDVSYTDASDSTPDADGEIFAATTGSGATRVADGSGWGSILSFRVNTKDANGLFIGNVIDLFVANSSYIRIEEDASNYATYQVKGILTSGISGSDDARTGYFILQTTDAPLQSAGVFSRGASLTASLQIKTDQVIDGDLLVTGSLKASDLSTETLTAAEATIADATIGNLTAAYAKIDQIDADSIDTDILNSDSIVTRTIQSSNFELAYSDDPAVSLSFSPRDTSSFISTGAWDVRDGNTFNSTSVSYTDWNGWLGQHLRLDGSTLDNDAILATLVIGDVIKISSGTAELIVSIVETEVSGSDHTILLNSTGLSQTGTPATSGTIQLDLQSSEVSAGWEINEAGNAAFNNVDIRGDSSVASSSIGGDAFVFSARLTEDDSLAGAIPGSTFGTSGVLSATDGLFFTASTENSGSTLLFEEIAWLANARLTTGADTSVKSEYSDNDLSLSLLFRFYDEDDSQVGSTVTRTDTVTYASFLHGVSSMFSVIRSDSSFFEPLDIPSGAAYLDVSVTYSLPGTSNWGLVNFASITFIAGSLVSKDPSVAAAFIVSSEYDKFAAVVEGGRGMRVVPQVLFEGSSTFVDNIHVDTAEAGTQLMVEVSFTDAGTFNTQSIIHPLVVAKDTTDDKVEAGSMYSYDRYVGSVSANLVSVGGQDENEFISLSFSPSNELGSEISDQTITRVWTLMYW